MGNCCLERSRPGGGGGGSAGAMHYAARRTNPVWDTKEEEARKSDDAPVAAATEVKIRITRKQLEELLRRVEDGKHAGVGGAPVEEVISDLLCVASSTGSNFRHGEEGHWRPSLQTIPESEEGSD